MPVFRLWLAILLLSPAIALAEEAASDQVSYYRDVRPIFQGNCQGCHQPAKRGGDYLMTDHQSLLSGGESGSAAIVAGDPAASHLIELIKAVDGKAEMPKGKPPLSEADQKIILNWILQGAKDDTPDSAKEKYDAEHPPSYVRPPVLTGVEFSPDGSLLAVSGYHEVLLQKADGSGMAGRLVGMSERIESLAFSPDGTQLAVAGGSPGRLGELQVWNVADQKLAYSVPVSYDNVYGASWSPDGKLIAIGCGDKSVRAFEASSGKQVFFNGAHEDWALDTVFSKDGSHLVSVSRDMAVKLYEVKTQRFVDNVTSITPGALKGGINAVARFPGEDQVLIGGADGVPKIYRLFREQARKIGDDFNKIKDFPEMPGRIYDVAFTSDAAKAVACSSLDGAGHVHVFTVADGKKVLELEGPLHAVYSISISPDNKRIAVVGFDGEVLLYDLETGKRLQQFPAVPITTQTASNPQSRLRFFPIGFRSMNLKTILACLVLFGVATVGLAEDASNKIPPGKNIQRIVAFPEKVSLEGPFAYAQILITAELESGEQVDLTRVAQRTDNWDAVSITPNGLVTPNTDAVGELVFQVEGQEVKVPVEVKDSHATYEADFIRDVTPAMSKMGCNQGTCHGAKDGKNGFKLSLRGYDPTYDHRALVDDIAGRRFNRAVPDQSLMLLKTSGVVPHVGGQLTKPGERRYEILKNWIAGGVQLNLDSPRVEKIKIYPANPTVPLPGMSQQFAIYATLTDGKVIDVTADAFIESGDIEIATADQNGVLKLLRRGEAPVLARYDGAYDATTVTVMGDRTGFEWVQQPQHNYIDKLVDEKLQRVNVQSSGLCTDDQFVRRVYLDLTGLPPTSDQARAFLDDKLPSQEKRDALIDQLIGSGPYVEYWTNKWCDLLQVNQKFLGDPGVHALRNWIKDSVASNKPYDQMVYEILTASGSTIDHPASAYYKILRTPEDTMENTTQLFLAVRFNCNKCHDHPFERWTQNQYYNLSAFFAQIGRKEDKRFAGQRIGGSAVEGATPLVEVIYDTGSGEVKHLLTGKVTPPEFPYQADLAVDDGTRREELAEWLTDPSNQYFATSYVNRMWGYLLGRGIIEPIDDIRAGNPPTNPMLLEALTQSFIDSGFNTRQIVREICKSRSYQQAIATNKWNEDDSINFSHAMPRRLPAEVLFDSIHQVTGSNYNLPQLPSGFRAAQLPGTDVNIPFLDDFGKPARESSCECERATGVMLGPVMKLVNGPVISNAIADKNNALAKLATDVTDDRALIDEVFLRFLGRHASDEEVKLGVELMNEPTPDLEVAQKTLDDHRQQLMAKMPQWEASLGRIASWTPLSMLEGTSKAGVKFEKKDDESILATGPVAKDEYEVIYQLAAGPLTGLRLEAMPDDSLPGKGPGRAQNGNFVLSELKAQVRLADGSEGPEVSFHRAEATFSQANYDARGAIDGNLVSGWAVSPRFGEKHTALFEVDGDITIPDGAKLVVRMDQQYQDSTHLLGRFRLSATSSERPVRLENNLPADIQQIIAKPADQRTEEEKQKLVTMYISGDALLKDLEAKLNQAKSLDENRRLAGLQDLAWALINSPAFLFNR